MARSGADDAAPARPPSPRRTRGAASSVRAAGQSVPQRAGGAEGAGTAGAEGAGAARDGPAQEDLDEEAAPKKRKFTKRRKLCLCDLDSCKAEVEGGRWLSHGLPHRDVGLCRAWLRVLCESISEEVRDERATNAATNGLRVHTSHFRNRDKKWAGAQLRLQDGAMPIRNRVSSVPLTQGAVLEEEAFTFDGDAGAGPRRNKSSASAPFVSPPGRDTGTALSGRTLLAGSGASHPSGGAGGSSGARDMLDTLTPSKARHVAGIHTVVAGVTVKAFHRDTDKEKVDRHLAALVTIRRLIRTRYGVHFDIPSPPLLPMSRRWDMPGSRASRAPFGGAGDANPKTPPKTLPASFTRHVRIL